MNPLKKITFLVVLSTAFYAFNTKEKNETPLVLNTENLNVIELLSSQKNECRPTSKYSFYVESELSNDRTPTINAKIYMLDRKTQAISLLADEKIKVSENETSSSDTSKFLKNGDLIIGNASKDLYSFKELIKFETIYSSYIKSTNKLLDLKRSL